MSESGWYYKQGGTSFGPVGRDGFEQLVAAGAIRPDTLVRPQGSGRWRAASRFFDFTGYDSASPSGIEPGAGASDGRWLDPLTPADPYQGAPARGFGEAVLVCLRKSATFSGRASRSEYWYFFLFCCLFFVVWGYVVLVVGRQSDGLLFALVWIGNAVLQIPLTAAGFRRLHDTGRSGWWIGGQWLLNLALMLLGGVVSSEVIYAFLRHGAGVEYVRAVEQMQAGPILGSVMSAGGLVATAWWIVVLIFLCRKGHPGPNRYG